MGCFMICLRAATKYAALSERNSLEEPRRAMNLQIAIKQFYVVRLSVVSRWIARFVKQVKSQI